MSYAPYLVWNMDGVNLTLGYEILGWVYVGINNLITTTCVMFDGN
jgi:hypothetical protein